MNSTEAFRHYKHDILGKFKDVSMAINALDENSFSDPENYEMFHAIHEVILKMVKTSRNTIAQQLNQVIKLHVSNQTPDLGMSKLQIEGVTVRFNTDQTEMHYFYFKSENTGELEEHLSIIKSLLPIKTTIIEN